LGETSPSPHEAHQAFARFPESVRRFRKNNNPGLKEIYPESDCRNSMMKK
jgi:hypothetical protein